MFEFAKLVSLCGLLGYFAEGTFFQSIGVLVGAPSRRIYIQSSISFLQHYLLVVTEFTSIIRLKVGGVDCKPGILVNFTLFVLPTGNITANNPTISPV